ncbi:MAG: hypothetical protein H0X03_05670 [Nitrosopumilus sp.]|nr:hypothetical protein [Nitrosopumilus sp.]
MNAGQFTKNVLNLDDNILFTGIVEKSGHLSSSNNRANVDEYLKGRNLEMIYSQSIYVTDLRKMLSPSFGNLNSIIYVYETLKILLFPIKDHVLLVFIDKNIETDNLIKKIYEYKDSLNNLDLYSI